MASNESMHAAFGAATRFCGMQFYSIKYFFTKRTKFAQFV